ncbi:MAG: GGDEF domain-containing protein [Phycisphaerales bacterium]|nr:GGDEF domain-containing protein [Phycisphaerales bacterium]
MGEKRHTSFPRLGLLSRDEALRLACATELPAHFGRQCLELADTATEAMQFADDAIDLLIIDVAALITDPNHHPGRAAPHALTTLLEDLKGKAPAVVVGPVDESLWIAEVMEAGAIDVSARSWMLAGHSAFIVESALAKAYAQRRHELTMRELHQGVDELRARNEALELCVSKLENEAWTDALTGLANRRQLESVLDQMFSEAVRYQTELSCLMIDLDRFKAVNDMHGHAVGDKILRLVGKVISAGIRASDVAARYGGDEFVVLMPRTTIDVAQGVATRLTESFLRQVEAWQTVHGVAESLCGMTIGVSSLSRSGALDGVALVDAADHELYANKGQALRDATMSGPTRRRAS